MSRAAASFIAGIGVNTWMQYQANNGWCGFDLMAALKWGISAAVAFSLITMTILSGGSLLGMGLQGLGVLFNNVTLFGAGLSFSSVATAAAVWFMTGKAGIWRLPKLFQSPGNHRQQEILG
ncbi:MAG: hypothetical protein IIC79_05375 [Chloroflexi bacterium]|nr:hypothetical protein [Chloroflexota bacterium]